MSRTDNLFVIHHPRVLKAVYLHTSNCGSQLATTPIVKAIVHMDFYGHLLFPVEHFSMNNPRILHVCPGFLEAWQSWMYPLILCRLGSMCDERISSKKHHVFCMVVCSCAVDTAQWEHVWHTMYAPNNHLVPEHLEEPSNFLHIWSTHSASPCDSCLYRFLQHVHVL